MSIVVAALARCFKYNGMTLPDIPGLSVEQVRRSTPRSTRNC